MDAPEAAELIESFALAGEVAVREVAGQVVAVLAAAFADFAA